jgi:hypothetical protein
MIETLIASTFATALSSTIIGQVLIGPNLLRTDYLTPTDQVITIQETIQEVPDTEPCNL